MRISKPAANGTSSRQPRRTAELPGVPPRLWPQLPIETRRHLAQRIGQLVQRLLPESERAEEGERADFDVVDR